MQYKYSVNGKTYLLPEEQVEAFLKTFPNAQLIETVGDTAGKQPGVSAEAATASPENVAAEKELQSASTSSELSFMEKLQLAQNVAPGLKLPAAGTVDAFGNFASSVFKLGEGVTDIANSLVLAGVGMTKDDFGPEQRKAMLLALENSAFTGGIPRPTSSTFGNAAELFRENLTKKYKYNSITEAIEADDYEAASEMTVSGFFASAPYTLAAMYGTPGLILMGGGVAGNKFREEIEAGTDSSLGTIITNSALTGTVEGLFDRYTAGLFSKARRAIKPNDLDAAKDIIKNGLRPIVKKLVGGTLGEAGTEAGTELTNAYVDRLTFDRSTKWKDIKYNIIDAAILGAVTGGGLKGVEAGGMATYGKQRAEALLMGEPEKTVINNLNNRILQNNKKLAEGNIDGIQEVQLQSENNDLMQIIFEKTQLNAIRVNSMNNSELTVYVDNAKKQQDLLSLLEIKNEDVKVQEARKRQFQNLANENMQIAEQAIERKGTELYENYASTLQKKEVQQYIGAKVRRFKTEEAFKEYVGEEAIKDKRKTFTDRGKNAAYYNSDTNEIVLKDYEVFDERGANRFLAASTPTHEATHAIIKKVFKTPELIKKHGVALQSHINELGGYFSSQYGYGNLRMEAYRQEAADNEARAGQATARLPYGQRQKILDKFTLDNEAFLADEAMAAVSDGIHYGFIQKNDNVLEKIANSIRRMFNDVTGKEITFETPEQTFNFLKDLNNDVKKGRLSHSMKKTLRKNTDGKTVGETIIAKNTESLTDFFGPVFREYAKNSTSDKIRQTFKEFEEVHKNSSPARKKGGAMHVALLFKGNVIDKLQKHSQRPQYEIYKDQIINDFILDDKVGVTNLIIKHSESGKGGTVDGYVNTYLGRRLDEYTNKYLPDLTEEENAELLESIKKEREKAGPDPSEIEEQLKADQANFKINTIDKLNLPGEIAAEAQEVATRSIALNIPIIEKEAGKPFRQAISEASKRILSFNQTSLDVALKGKSGDRKKNFETFFTNNAKALYEVFDIADFVASKKDLKTKFIDALKRKDGTQARTNVNYAKFDSYAGNNAYRKRPYEEIKEEWQNQFVVPKGLVPKSSEYRQITETNYRRLRDVLANKITNDQLSFLLNNNDRFKELLDVQGVELTRQLTDKLNRNLRQGQFAILESKKVNSFFLANPEKALEILNIMPVIESKILGDKKSMGQAFAEAYPHLPEDIAGEVESGLNLFHVREAKKVDDKTREEIEKKFKKQQPQKIVADMIDRKSDRAAKIKSGKSKVLAQLQAEKRGLWEKLSKEYGFIPYNAEDFEGMLYNLYGKGTQGDADKTWMYDNLIKPYFAATEQIDTDRLEVANKIKVLEQTFNAIPNKKLTDKIKSNAEIEDFTIEEAIRVWNFVNNTENITQTAKDLDLDVTTTRALLNYVESLPEIKNFALQVASSAGVDGYPDATDSWRGSNIAYDIIEVLNDARRARALKTWKHNLQASGLYSFEEGAENLKVRNKMLAAFGNDFIINFDNIVKRMETGRNRPQGGDPKINKFFGWINAAQANIMFLNTKSAGLQLISTSNFINVSDNNPLAAAEAFANQEQYWEDFAMILNSDFIKARQKGTTINIVEEDFVRSVQKAQTLGKKWQKSIGYLLEKGYVLTRIGDATAIAAGGATFYRNRVNRLIKEGMDREKAQKTAFSDLRATALKSQQSSDAALVSNLQAGVLGRFVFAFANTPFQYNRLMKKAISDLVNKRGNPKEHMAKLANYAIIQNIMFNSLQSAIFALAAGKEDEEEQEEFKGEKIERVANGMISSILRGSGLSGAGLDTLKNIAVAVKDEADDPELFQDNFLAFVNSVTDIAPPLDHKMRKMKIFLRGFDANNMEWKQKYDSPFPQYIESIANGVEGIANIPLGRALKKIENINHLFSDDEMLIWQKLALSLGWSTWDLGIEDKQGLLGGELYKKERKRKFSKITN